MRPRTERDGQGVVAVLNTLPELKLVLHEIEHTDWTNSPGETLEDWADSLGVRFRRQTQHEPKPPKADAYVEPVWNCDAEFPILVQDVDFVANAARRVTDSTGLFGLFNAVSKRTKAAREMLETLESVSTGS